MRDLDSFEEEQEETVTVKVTVPKGGKDSFLHHLDVMLENEGFDDCNWEVEDD